jgi:Spy/CpxP family protein refolding chaperone
MKRFLLIAALVGVVSFAGLSMVNAHGNYGFGPGKGYGNCEGYGSFNSSFYDDADKEKVNTFREETKETRKQIAIKKSERRALMNQDNPDEKRVARLTGEIYDLKNLLEEKAKEAFGEYLPFGHKRARGRFGNCDRVPRNL